MILIKFLIVSLPFVYGEWCTRQIPVYKTKMVTFLNFKIVAKKGWIGKNKNTMEPFHDTKIESEVQLEDVRECCPGYLQRGDSCVAICRRSCLPNSNCVEPNVCECNKGYIESMNSTSPFRPTCIPVCSQICPENASCVAPETCDCNKGYQLNVTTKKCKPTCSSTCSTNEYCKEPDICECKAGYTRVKTTGVCQLSCSQNDCPEHSKCIAPGQCECEEGYKGEFDLEANFVCMEIDPCLAQPCVDINSFCIAPNSCVCYVGYAFDEKKICQPVCETPCTPHSTCIEPNLCACEQGYFERKTSLNRTECYPVCPEDCAPNGHCLQPHNCTCKEGFKFNSNGQCDPICSKSCINGNCIAPDTCACNDGFLLSSSSPFVCVPKCEPACVNSNCIAPNVCDCWPKHLAQPAQPHICDSTNLIVARDCQTNCACWQSRSLDLYRTYNESCARVCSPNDLNCSPLLDCSCSSVELQQLQCSYATAVMSNPVQMTFKCTRFYEKAETALLQEWSKCKIVRLILILLLVTGVCCIVLLLIAWCQAAYDAKKEDAAAVLYIRNRDVTSL